MRKILKEPFLHFVAIGFSFFVLYGIVNKNDDSVDTIVINDDDISELIAKWETQWKRDPDEKELYGLISHDLRQEIYYREALKMNLDENDEIIKRHLSQKMKFLTNDLASLKKVSDEELMSYYNENSHRYITSTLFSLYQIIFTSDNRKDPKGDAERTLKKNKGASFEEMKSKGDELPIPYYFENLTEEELRLELGVDFRDKVKSAKINQWVGPISSGYGSHLVYITEKRAPELPKLEDVKVKVIGDYEYDNQEKLEEDIYVELKKSYEIELDIKSEDFDPEFVKLLEEEINK